MGILKLSLVFFSFNLKLEIQITEFDIIVIIGIANTKSDIREIYNT